MSIRILVADDSPFWRNQLKEILHQVPNSIVFEASNGYEAVYRSRWVHPDVVILDMSMPVLDGLGAARRLKKITPELPILIVTVVKTALLEVAASDAGV